MCVTFIYNEVFSVFLVEVRALLLIMNKSMVSVLLSLHFHGLYNLEKVFLLRKGGQFGSSYV